MNGILNHFKEHKKDLLNLIFLIILVASLPFAFKLAKDRQIFFSKASNSPVQVINSGNNDVKEVNGMIETTSPNLDLKLTSPLELKEQGFNFNLIGNVYAAGPQQYGKPENGDRFIPYPKDEAECRNNTIIMKDTGTIARVGDCKNIPPDNKGNVRICAIAKLDQAGEVVDDSANGESVVACFIDKTKGGGGAPAPAGGDVEYKNDKDYTYYCKSNNRVIADGPYGDNPEHDCPVSAPTCVPVNNEGVKCIKDEHEIVFVNDTSADYSCNSYDTVYIDGQNLLLGVGSGFNYYYKCPSFAPKCEKVNDNSVKCTSNRAVPAAPAGSVGGVQGDEYEIPNTRWSVASECSGSRIITGALGAYNLQIDCHDIIDESGQPAFCRRWAGVLGAGLGPTYCAGHKKAATSGGGQVSSLVNKSPGKVGGEKLPLAGESKVTFTWSGNNSIKTYRLIINRDDKSVSPRASNKCPVTKPFDISKAYVCLERKWDSRVELGSADNADLFEDGATYTWWVDALDDKGNVIGTSEGFTFTVDKSTKPGAGGGGVSAGSAGSGRGGAAGGSTAISCPGYIQPCAGGGYQACIGGVIEKDAEPADFNINCKFDANKTNCYPQSKCEPTVEAAMAAAPSPAGGGSSPAAPGGAPAQPADTKGEGNNDPVTLCGDLMPLGNARNLTGLSTGSRQQVSAEYLKKFCPGSQNNCALEPNFPEIVNDATPNGYIWVANCNSNRACLRNNSVTASDPTGNSKDGIVEPGDPAACPKNLTDPSVNPATSNWCYGFAGSGENNNRCMVLWSKAKYEELKRTNKSPFDLGSGIAAGNANVPGVTPRATPVATPATRTSVNWQKASCSTDKKFSGCTLAGGNVCSSFGENTDAYKASGWTLDEYNKCRELCSKYGSAKNDAAACGVSAVATEAPKPEPGKQTIGGSVVFSSCNNKPAEGMVVTVFNDKQEKQTAVVDKDGKFAVYNFVELEKAYQVAVIPTGVNNAKFDSVNLIYYSQKKGSNADCNTNCDFKLTGACTESPARPNATTSPVRKTAQFRIADNTTRSQMNDPEWGWYSYTAGGMSNYKFTFSEGNRAPGTKTIFVQFRDEEKRIISDDTHKDGLYVINVNLKAVSSPVATPAQGEPAATSAPAATPVVAAAVCPVTSSCCSSPLQTCGTTATFNRETSIDTSCPAGFQWCNGGYCVNQNYNETTRACPAPVTVGRTCSKDSYGDPSVIGKKAWCDCAESLGDTGALINGPDGTGKDPCSQASKQAASCSDRSVFPLKNTRGNQTYSFKCDDMDVCNRPSHTDDSLFTCTGDDTYRCTGEYRCGGSGSTSTGGSVTSGGGGGASTEYQPE